MSLINPIAGFIVGHVITLALEKAYLGAMLLMIQIDANRDLNAFEKILVEIKEHEGELTDEEQEAFNDRLALAGLELIRIDV
jgi:hypothetical protein